MLSDYTRTVSGSKNIDQDPLVSVIVPSYNHAEYITNCIESIVNQTYQNTELIVIDDGSTDDSRSVLESLQSKYSFRLIFQANKGVAKTLTEAVQKYATGEYISVCASDDFYHPERIRTQVDFLEKHPELPACFTNTFYIAKDSGILIIPDCTADSKKFEKPDLFSDLLQLKVILPVTFLYRKNLLQEINYFSEKHYCEDFFVTLNITSRYQIGYLPLNLHYYRVQPNSAIKTRRIIDSQKEIIELYPGHPAYSKALKKWELRRIVEFSRYTAHKLDCLAALMTLSFVNEKSYWKSWVRLFVYWRN